MQHKWEVKLIKTNAAMAEVFEVVTAWDPNKIDHNDVGVACQIIEERDRKIPHRLVSVSYVGPIE